MGNLLVFKNQQRKQLIHLRISQQQALSDFSDLASRLGASGVSLKELENIYGGFNTLLIQNAVGTQQAAAAQLQLNQALGSVAV